MAGDRLVIPYSVSMCVRTESIESTASDVEMQGPGGSSSGHSIAVSAGFAPVAIGTETSGSLIFPADRAALYTIKPTAGIVPQAGIVPISHRFDIAGPMAKCSQDVALLLDVMVDHTKTRVPDKGYIACADNSWQKLRVGILDPESWLYDDALVGYADGSKEQIVCILSEVRDKI